VMKRVPISRRVYRNAAASCFLDPSIEDGHDFVAGGNRERPAGTKVVLNIDYQQCIAMLHAGYSKAKFRDGCVVSLILEKRELGKRRNRPGITG